MRNGNENQYKNKNMTKVQKEVKIGDIVTWVCKPNALPKFTCFGKVDAFKTAAGFKAGASIIIDHDRTPQFKSAFPGRNKTSVGLDKLTVL
jgi:hypothetical protein